jgi:hypothetical protein
MAPDRLLLDKSNRFSPTADMDAKLCRQQVGGGQRWRLGGSGGLTAFQVAPAAQAQQG